MSSKMMTYQRVLQDHYICMCFSQNVSLFQVQYMHVFCISRHDFFFRKRLFLHSWCAVFVILTTYMIQPITVFMRKNTYPSQQSKKNNLQSCLLRRVFFLSVKAWHWWSCSCYRFVGYELRGYVRAASRKRRRGL